MSIAATKIQDIRINNPEFDKNENRLSQYGALDFFLNASKRNPLLTDEMKAQALDGAGKTLQIPAIDYDGGISVSHSRSCTIPDAENTSKLINVEFVTYSVGFTMVPALYSNNEIGYNKDFATKLKKCARVLGASLDEAAIAKLEAQKSQVVSNPLIYNYVGQTVKVPFASREEILSDIEPILNADDFYGGVHIIGNAGVKSLLNKLVESGLYNEKNKTYEYAGKDFHISNRIPNASAYATFYAVEEGNVDTLIQVDREAYNRATSKTGHEWDIINMPYLDMPVGVHHYEEVGDQSQIAGAASTDLTCARKEFYGFSADVAFITAYNSSISTRPNPIVKVEIAKGNSYAQPVVIANTDTDPVPTKTVGA